MRFVLQSAKKEKTHTSNSPSQPLSLIFEMTRARDPKLILFASPEGMQKMERKREKETAAEVRGQVIAKMQFSVVFLSLSTWATTAR